MRAYDQCFLTLRCEGFDRKLPAWLLGAEEAPCACGVVERGGHFATLGVLPDVLAACRGLLPLASPQPRPGDSWHCE
jgi:hypothetical protein